VSFLLDKTPPI